MRAQTSSASGGGYAGSDGLGRLQTVDPSTIISRHNGSISNPVSYEQLFLDNLPLIKSIVARVAWRGRLAPDQRDDFGSQVFLRLVEDDYEVLRRFQHRSTLAAYLAVVIQRLFQDFRNQQWGKWRPSMEARRAGVTAVHLERLMTRDGLTFDEAVTVLRTAYGVEESRDVLYTISQRFPTRVDRRPHDDEVLAQHAGNGPAADSNVIREGLRELATRAHETLNRAVGGLDPDDRLLIQLCFWERMSVANIARSFGVAQKPLYGRIQRLLTQLRRALERDGVVDEARGLLDHLWSDLVETSGDHTGDVAGVKTQTGIEGMRPSMDGEVSSVRR